MELTLLQIIGIAIALGSIIPLVFAYHIQKNAFEKTPIIFPTQTFEKQNSINQFERRIGHLTLQWRIMILINTSMVISGALISGGAIIALLAIIVYVIPMICNARSPFQGASSNPLDRIEKYLDKVAEMNKDNHDRITLAIQKVHDDYALSDSEYDKLLLYLSERCDIIGDIAKELRDSSLLS